jgi:glucosamine-6-phosphate deaminase
MRVHVVEPAGFGAAGAELLLAVLRWHPGPVVGLATGATPIPVYEALTDARCDRWIEAVRPFGIDEYRGDPRDPGSNRSFFARFWEPRPGARPVEQFRGDAPSPRDEVRRFCSRVSEVGGLDVAVLGIGMNGHLAFNEPGTMPRDGARLVTLAPSTRRAAALTWRHPPRRGFTLGLREILAARRVLLLARGEAKAAIVARALEGKVGPACPASYLQRHPALTVMLDSAAAGQLVVRRS